MANKSEFIIGGLAVLAVAVALIAVRGDSVSLQSLTADVADRQVALSVVSEEGDQTAAREAAISDSVDRDGNVTKLVVDDITKGAGQTVEVGDTVSVHYIGRLENGREFDNSHQRGEPFTFTIGDGQVIEGWEQGIAGMQVGGERVLVVPPSLGYGDQAVGPIPPNSTLIFAVELVAIDE